MKKIDFIIAYDIRDDKRLRKMAKLLENEALRVQFSVFYIKCDKKKLFEIIDKIKKIIDEEEDDVRIYKINLSKTLFLQKSQSVKKLIV